MDTFSIEVFIPLIIAAISLAFNVWNNIRELNYKKKVLQEDRIVDKRKEIGKKLNEFYGPFLQNAKKSTTVYRALTKNRKDFRLLDYLLDNSKDKGEKIDPNDNILINEIVEIGKQQQDLIKEKAGLIDDPVLSNYYIDVKAKTDLEIQRRDLQNIGLIPRANAHYRILELAHEHKLSGDAQRYEDYRFPRDLVPELERRISELQQQMEKLRAPLLKEKQRIKWQLLLTKRSYNKFAKEYDENVSNLLKQSTYDAFTQRLPEKAKILDLGCGSGRDALYFEKRGFQVTGILF
jgi:hypothetical protein